MDASFLVRQFSALINVYVKMMDITPEIAIEPKILQSLSSQQAWHYRAIPFEYSSTSLSLFVDEQGLKVEHKDELEMIKSLEIVTVPLETSLLNNLLHRFYRNQNHSKTTSKVSVNADRIETFVDDLVKEAKDIGSSDIHIEAFEGGSRVRIRIDGKLIEKYHISKLDYPSLVNKIKIRSGLDIAEKRLPQDGRIKFQEHGDQFDIRVSVLPTLYGEKIVMRILNQDASALDLDKIGMNTEQLIKFKHAIRKPDGIILISGPTGSGKTTTLYAALKTLNQPSVNISTIEDPIEYTLDGINQVQLKENIGLTFSNALRTFLRQDPDIIMLGEIRDAETAQMAIRASLTGHLVLSTIHTNSALDTILRLIDMGIPSFLLASTIQLSIAQRLIRTLCPECKIQIDVSKVEWPIHFIPKFSISYIYSPVGCEHCYFTGYKGRKALYEILEIDGRIRAAIRNGDELTNHVDASHQWLSDIAFATLADGQTSIDEVYPFLQKV